jgi:oligopeptide/dipeptide ABC transporter ATP-binding protein
MTNETPIVVAEGLAKEFAFARPFFDRMRGKAAPVLRAVRGVDLAIMRGETLGLIGESGCGKSTLGRLLLRLQTPSAGRVHFDGRDLGELDAGEMRRLRRRMQIVFQDPYASLNPRRTVEELVGLPLRLHGLAEGDGLRARVEAMLALVGLSRMHMQRYPHQFSGGQRQRIGIARALILDPEFVVCDEPVSALDVSVQAQVIELLRDLRRRLSLTYLFVSHDIAVVAHISDRVAVMYMGKIVEIGKRNDVLSRPAHPYTRALLSALPPLVRGSARFDVGRVRGEPPSPLAPPSGCAFHPRCPAAGPRCSRETPVLGTGDLQTHRVACHLDAGGVA